MSVRKDVAVPARNDASLSRLTQILELGMSTMSIKSPMMDNMGQNQINTAAHNMVPITNMGLNLWSAILPTGPNQITREQTTVIKDRVLTDLATYSLRRPNNRSQGVVWSDEKGNEATVLFISNNSNYEDSYLNYMEALIARRADTPEVVYDYPKLSNKTSESMIDPSKAANYQNKAAAHFKKLKERSRTDPASGDFSKPYYQPHTKIYLFYKIPVTKAAQSLPYGPYLYFGRFQAVYDDNTQQIRLRKFVVPQIDMANERQVVSLRNLAATVDLSDVTGSDIRTVHSMLSDASARASSSRFSHRPVPRPPQPQPQPAFVTPAQPAPSVRPQATTPADDNRPRPYRIRRRSLDVEVPPALRPRHDPEADADSDLEDGEIRE